MDENKEAPSEETESEGYKLSHKQARITEWSGKVEWFPALEQEFRQNIISVLHIITFILSTIIGIVLMANGDKLLSVIPTAIASKVIMHYVPIDVEEMLSD